MIVTIDGPAGSGKSTVARLLAEKLDVRYLDTGAMYRAVALAIVRAKIDEKDAAAVAEKARQLSITFDDDELLLDGEPVSGAIRCPEVTAIASIVAANPDVRAVLVELQRAVGKSGSLVTEGRDQGTVVFPHADHKFFVTASVDARARRRHGEMVSKGSTLTLETVTTQLRQRDTRDENRVHAPMKPARDATIVDTSEMSIAQVVDTLARRVRGKAAK
ncbi:MAG: (d)CMP kinase [Planctomycetaceae bacterium]